MDSITAPHYERYTQVSSTHKTWKIAHKDGNLLDVSQGDIFHHLEQRREISIADCSGTLLEGYDRSSNSIGQCVAYYRVGIVFGEHGWAPGPLPPKP